MRVPMNPAVAIVLGASWCSAGCATAAAPTSELAETDGGTTASGSGGGRDGSTSSSGGSDSGSGSASGSSSGGNSSSSSDSSSGTPSDGGSGSGGDAGSGGYAGAISKYGSYSRQYYVSPSGSDSNPGSESQPWATLAHADPSAPSCSVVWFLPGTYDLTGADGEGITTSGSGTSSCHKAYVSTTYGGALIRWNGSGNGDSLWVEAGDYTDHVGFDVTLPGGCEGWYGGGTTGGVYLYNRVHDIDVAGAADPSWCGNGVGGGGIEPGTNHGTIADNVIWNVGQSGNHWAHGVYVGGGHMQIYNNVIYNASGACLQDYNNSEYDVIVNNTFVACQSFGIAIGGESCDGNNAGNDYVANNIFDGNPPTGWGNIASSCGSGSIAPSTFTNNLNYGGGGIQLGSGGTVVDTVTGAPGFVNATSPGSGGDFHLQAVSAAAGAGTGTNAPGLDMDGNPRGNPPSIGAYEQ